MLEQWGVDPNPKTSLGALREDTLEMFPAVPADEVEKPPVRPHNDHQRERKRKDASFIVIQMG